MAIVEFPYEMAYRFWPKKKKPFWDFDKDCIEPVEDCGTYFHFNKISIISVLIHDFGLFPFYLEFLSAIFFFKFSQYKFFFFSFNFFAKFIPVYFILLDAFVSEIFKI